MKVEIHDNYETLSERAAEIFKTTILSNPTTVLGLATGSTPLGLYRALIDTYSNDEITFRHVRTYNLDEYLGIDHDHPQSYASFMKRNLFNHVDIAKKNIHLPKSDETRKEAIVKDYNDALKNERIDLQVLGIGQNGHIGFNEPGTPLNQETFITELDAQTRLDNARFFDTPEDVPTHAITMGIKNIMHARRIVLIASGATKAGAVAKMIRGPVSPSLPASVLQLHPDCTVLLDKAAASLL